MLLRYMECIDSEVMQTLVKNTYSQLTLNIVESIDRILIHEIPILPAHLPFIYKSLQYSLKIVFTVTTQKLETQPLQVAGLRTRRILDL